MKTLDLKLNLGVTFYDTGAVSVAGVRYGESTNVARFMKSRAFDQHREEYVKFEDERRTGMKLQAQELVGMAKDMVAYASDEEEVDASHSELQILESIIKKLKETIPARIQKDLEINAEFRGGWYGKYIRETRENPAEYPEFEVEDFKVEVDGLRIIEFYDMYEIIKKELKHHEHQLTMAPILLAYSKQSREMLERELEDDYEVEVKIKIDSRYYADFTTEIDVYVGSNGDDGFKVNIETKLEEMILEHIKEVKVDYSDY